MVIYISLEKVFPRESEHLAHAVPYGAIVFCLAEILSTSTLCSPGKSLPLAPEYWAARGWIQNQDTG